MNVISRLFGENKAIFCKFNVIFNFEWWLKISAQIIDLTLEFQSLALSICFSVEGALFSSFSFSSDQISLIFLSTSFKPCIPRFSLYITTKYDLVRFHFFSPQKIKHTSFSHFQDSSYTHPFKDFMQFHV